METNQEFTATTLERLQQACGAWYLAPVDDSPSVPMTSRGRAR